MTAEGSDDTSTDSPPESMIMTIVLEVLRTNEMNKAARMLSRSHRDVVDLLIRSIHCPLEYRAETLPRRLMTSCPNLRLINTIFLKSLAGIHRGIEELRIDCTKVADIGPIRVCMGLKKLSCSSCPIRDFSPVTACKGLVELDCSDCRITDISFCAQLTALEKFACSGCTLVHEISPLSNCPRLKSLDISRTRVRSLVPIIGSSQLEYLDIRDTDTPCVPFWGGCQLPNVAACTNLKVLLVDVDPNPQCYMQLNSLQQVSPNLQIHMYRNKWFSWWAYQNGSWCDCLVDCPNGLIFKGKNRDG